MSAEVAAAWVALGGTLIVLIYNIFDRNMSAFNDRMSQATDLLTGHTQRRSAGIAIIEGSQRRIIRSKRTWLMAMTGLLCAQAVYLLKSSGQDKRQDEILNLKRIVELLIRFRRHLPDKTPFADVVGALQEPAERKQPEKGEEPGEHDKGLDRSAIKTMFGNDIFDKWTRSLSLLCRIIGGPLN
jgi:hypothetical protein